MTQQLIDSIFAMRAVVLTRLALRQRMFADPAFVQRLVVRYDDTEVWSRILHANKGILGFCRRLLSRIRARSIFSRE